MQTQESPAAICPGCGTRLAGGFSHGLGRCMICLLHVGFGGNGAEVDDDLEAPVVDRLGSYRIERHDDGELWELGRGAMGVTYRATDTSLHRRVALKLIDAEWIKRGAEARERFMREARVAAALRHPNVATVYQFGVHEESGQYFCAMELVEGETLETRVRRTGPLDALATVEIALQVSSALAAAEKQGLVHRDLKPGNLMLTSGDEEIIVKVIDFGVAKALADAPDAMGLTQGGFVGTPAFASPEQFSSAPVDVRADIYSLGATLCYLLTGRMPFPGKTLDEIRTSRAAAAIPLVQLRAAGAPLRLISLLAEMLAPEPAARPGVRALTARLQECRAQLLDRWKTPRRLALAAAVIALAGAVAFPVFQRSQEQEIAAYVPPKSIAVLPFENLSADQSDPHFAEGIQDQILTKLASLADLKVISRISTEKYGSKPGDLKSVSQELGVATVLQGTVQKDGERVRVKVELMEASSDKLVWEKTYDSDLRDVFTIQSEISQEIGNALRARVSANEAVILAAAATRDPEAYDLFLRGEYEQRQGESLVNAEPVGRAADFYRRALSLDPSFALAAARLARSRLWWHWLISPLAPAELSKVKTLAEGAVASAPDLAEAHVSLALFHYLGHREYKQAIAAFQRALELQPNHADARKFSGFVYRRMGQWERSLAEMAKAEELDPRDDTIPGNMAATYVNLRQWNDAKRAASRSLTLHPHNQVGLRNLFLSCVNGDGRTDTARRVIGRLPPGVTLTTNAVRGNVSNIIEDFTYLHVLERDFAGALQQAGQEKADSQERDRQLVARVAIRVLAGDAASAIAESEEARALLEARLRERPDDAFAMTQLSWVYLALDRKADALRMAQQAAEWLPIEKDAFGGPSFAVGLAQIQARTGEAPEAVKSLRHLLTIPAGIAVSVNRLKLDPVWDPIRNDPEFQQLLAGKEAIGRYPGYRQERASGERPPEPDPSQSATKLKKSIAVLPFENISEDKAFAYFADGVQEEILTTLAKVANLKVISRTSVMRFRDAEKRDLREIARQLGVTHVLEGSVQRAGNRVRVSAQLTTPESGSHLWADRFDGELADVFGMQSAIAQKIVGRLDAVLSPAEQVALRARPTADIAAYDLYLRARELQSGNRTFEAIEKTAGLLDAAIARDPKFLAALSLLVQVHMQAYWFHLNHAPERLALATQALEKAAGLQPDAAEVHFARGVVHYFADRDFPRALEELKLARRSLPNDAEILRYIGYIERRRGQWPQALVTLGQAVTLDPGNVQLTSELAATYHSLRQYTEERRVLSAIQEWQPQNFGVLAALGRADADENADFARLESVVSGGEAAAVADPDTVANWRLSLALWRRDYRAAEKALSEYRKPEIRGQGFAIPREYFEGRVARGLGDADRAKSSFERARERAAEAVQRDPGDGQALCVLALTEAALQRKDAAMQTTERAVRLLPVSSDAVAGATLIAHRARVFAELGEADRAFEALREAVVLPHGLHYGELKLDERFDRIRTDSRFAPIVASLAPKDRLSAGVPKKSIAVLPFDNLSEDPANAHFAVGIQDEILTRLAKIADLKVISRASVMHYREGLRNLREIGHELKVAHLLEGSVQRAGGKVRVHAQLIDASTDAHLWAQSYDRDLADVFAIQTEIARAIAEQLQVRISAAERTAIEQRSTSDVAAFDLYTRARTLRLGSLLNAAGKRDLLQAVELLDEAVARDPAFLPAWCELAAVHDWLYFAGHDHSPARLALAETAVQTAARLSPDAGETHLAQAQHFFHGYLDYNRARAELAIAQRTLPNDPTLFNLAGNIDRRQGRWEESTRNFERAIELDPRNFYLLQNLTGNYRPLRRYTEMAAVLDRALAIAPHDVGTKVYRASLELDWRADPQPLRKTIERILADDPAAKPKVAAAWLRLALVERDADSAALAVAELAGSTRSTEEPNFVAGLMARARGDAAAAHAAFTAARTHQEKLCQAQPEYAPALGVLALIDAALGLTEAALSQGRRAMELLPVDKDAVGGALMIEIFANVCAWAGDKDQALEHLEKAARIPSGISYGQLKLHPLWDPLRGDPRFEALVASLAPK